jgi:hypothetical protein
MLKLSDEEVLYLLDVQLPEMLELNPELEPRVFRAFMKAFATKESVAAVLDELRALDNQVLHFRADTARNFEQVHREIQNLHTEMDQRFDQVDQRFGQVDQRFEQVDQRFGQVDQRFDQLDQKMDDLKDWVQLVVGRFQVRAGRNLEDVVAGTLRLALKRPDIGRDQIQLRQKLVDEGGHIGPAGRSYEVDILADDGRIIVFEVKSVCEVEDVDRLADKVTLMRHLHPDKRIEGVIVTLGAEEGVESRCADHNLLLVH